MVLIRELRDGDVEAFVELRREALLDSPLAFVASPSDDRFSAPETVREQFSCLTASRILFRNSSWLISLRMQPTTASEIARGTEDRQDAGGWPLSEGQPGLRMIMRIARHRCCSFSLYRCFLFRPAQQCEELERTRIACFFCVVIVNQSQARSSRLATRSNLFREDTQSLRLAIKAEKPYLLRLDKS